MSTVNEFATILFASISLLCILLIVKLPADFILLEFEISPSTINFPDISSSPVFTIPTVFKTPVLLIDVVSKESEVILAVTFIELQSILEFEINLLFNFTSPFKVDLFSTVKFLIFKSSKESDNPVKSIPFCIFKFFTSIESLVNLLLIVKLEFLSNFKILVFPLLIESAPNLSNSNKLFLLELSVPLPIIKDPSVTALLYEPNNVSYAQSVINPLPNILV